MALPALLKYSATRRCSGAESSVRDSTASPNTMCGLSTCNIEAVCSSQSLCSVRSASARRCSRYKEAIFRFRASAFRGRTRTASIPSCAARTMSDFSARSATSRIGRLLLFSSPRICLTNSKLTFPSPLVSARTRSKVESRRLLHASSKSWTRAGFIFQSWSHPCTSGLVTPSSLNNSTSIFERLSC